MERISIVGTSCSGKSTLAKVISAKFVIPYVELDDIHWQPGWKELEDAEFISLTKAEVDRSCWVIDGNYPAVRALVWSRATTIIWLDYSFPLVLAQAIKRSFYRALSKDRVCSGNVESFRQSFFSKESVILWVIKTHRKNRNNYARFLNQELANTASICILKSPQETKEFISALEGKRA